MNQSGKTTAAGTTAASRLMTFIDASPSPVHACSEIVTRLQAAGYALLDESKPWSVRAGGKYIVRRGAKLVAAVSLGKGDLAGSGTRIAAAHVDSPCLKIKRSALSKSDSGQIVNVGIYGSPILFTWMDRDLAAAGQVYVRGKNDRDVRRLLVRTNGPVCRLSSLAPHLKDETKDQNSAPVAAQHLKPLFGVAEAEAQGALERMLLASLPEADAREATVLGWDLSLADVQPSSLVGLGGEFISAPRLDNLMSSYSLLEALLGLSDTTPGETRIAIWYDSEEIGSQTATGARSDFLSTLIARLVEQTSGAGIEKLAMARANSLMLSVDMAHAENPGYPGRLDKDHAPKLNGGLAVKFGFQGNYADDRETAAWFEAACAERKVPLQHFMYQTGNRGGSSIGPIATTVAGIRGIDVGTALLGMHSIREMCGTADVAHTTAAVAAFLEADTWA